MGQAEAQDRIIWGNPQVALAALRSKDRILWKVLIDHWHDKRIVDPEYGGGDYSQSPDYLCTLRLGQFCRDLFLELTNMEGYSTQEEMREWWEKSKDLHAQEIEEQWAKGHGFSSWQELRKAYDHARR